MSDDRSSAEIAAATKEAYVQHVQVGMNALGERIHAAAKAADKATASIGGSREWEHAWLGDANRGMEIHPLNFTDDGIYVEYTSGQSYPEEGFIPYAVLDDPEVTFAPLVAKARAEKEVRDREWADSKRQRLLRQLADLDGGTKRQSLTDEIDALTDYDLNAR